jgi:hypothetical protein
VGALQVRTTDGSGSVCGIVASCVTAILGAVVAAEASVFARGSRDVKSSDNGEEQ